jgi:hypothetical protein
MKSVANICATIAGLYLSIGGVIPVPITILLVFARSAPNHGHAEPPEAPVCHHGI